MRIIGYGICGAGEAGRYMRATLDQFKLFCDTTIILLNNATKAEYDLVEEYGFLAVTDNREWGKEQWRIKQDLLDNHVSVLKPDWCLCLDMDETIHNFRRKDLEEYQTIADSLYVYIVNLWNDGHKPTRNFWNVRLWRWTGDTKMKQQALHCGLAPEWTYFVGAYSKVLMKHYGLMKKEDRDKKIARYAKYDPTARCIDRSYYDSLADNTCTPFVEYDIIEELNQYWQKYKPTKKKRIMQNKEQEYVYVQRLKDGATLAIPKRSLADTLKQGFVLVGDVTPENAWGNVGQDTPQVETTESVENPFACVLCGFQGKNKMSLSTHTRKAH